MPPDTHGRQRTPHFHFTPMLMTLLLIAAAADDADDY